MGDGLKRAIAATKATRKPKQLKGNVVAIKTRSTKANAWMPDKCNVLLEGDPDPKGRFLQVCGWIIYSEAQLPGPLGSIETEKWLVARLKRCLPKISQQWAEDFGKSWRLEIE